MGAARAGGIPAKRKPKFAERERNGGSRFRGNDPVGGGGDPGGGAMVPYVGGAMILRGDAMEL